MKLGLLFSGGKDSTLAGYLAIKQGYNLCCLISIDSENKDSYMFHTPFINQISKQADSMNIPLIIQKTKGEKENELIDLEKAIKKAKKEYGIKGIVTGAVESVYQASRIQNICNKLGLWCFNPLWQKPQIEILKMIIKEKFEVIIVGVAAEGFNKTWLGKKIDNNFIKEVMKLNKKYAINVAGEGGEFESFVLNCPIFKKRIRFNKKEVNLSGQGKNWRLVLK